MEFNSFKIFFYIFINILYLIILTCSERIIPEESLMKNDHYIKEIKDEKEKGLKMSGGREKRHLDNVVFENIEKRKEAVDFTIKKVSRIKRFGCWHSCNHPQKMRESIFEKILPNHEDNENKNIIYPDSQGQCHCEANDEREIKGQKIEEQMNSISVINATTENSNIIEAKTFDELAKKSNELDLAKKTNDLKKLFDDLKIRVKRGAKHRIAHKGGKSSYSSDRHKLMLNKEKNRGKRDIERIEALEGEDGQEREKRTRAESRHKSRQQALESREKYKILRRNNGKRKRIKHSIPTYIRDDEENRISEKSHFLRNQNHATKPKNEISKKGHIITLSATTPSRVDEEEKKKKVNLEEKMQTKERIIKNNNSSIYKDEEIVEDNNKNTKQSQKNEPNFAAEERGGGERRKRIAGGVDFSKKRLKGEERKVYSSLDLLQEIDDYTSLLSKSYDKIYNNDLMGEEGKRTKREKKETNSKVELNDKSNKNDIRNSTGSDSDKLGRRRRYNFHYYKTNQNKKGANIGNERDKWKNDFLQKRLSSSNMTKLAGKKPLFIIKPNILGYCDCKSHYSNNINVDDDYEYEEFY